MMRDLASGAVHRDLVLTNQYPSQDCFRAIVLMLSELYWYMTYSRYRREEAIPATLELCNGVT